MRIGVGGDISFRNHRSPLHLFAESILERSRLERTRHAAASSAAVELPGARPGVSRKNIFVFYFHFVTYNQHESTISWLMQYHE
jgi:hypothetical protein